MNEKILELLKNDDVQEKIKDLYCELDKKRFTEGSGMSGWEWKIMLDEDGDVDYMYNSSNTTRMDVHEGNAIVVAILKDDAEVSTEDMGDIEYEEDFEKFKEYLGQQFDLYEDVDSEDDKYLEKKEEYIEEHSTWMDYYEFNLEGFKKAEVEAWEAICDQCSYDVITDKLYDLIDEMQARQNYYDSIQQEEF